MPSFLLYPTFPHFSFLPLSDSLSLSFLLLPSNPDVSCLAMKQKAEEEVTSWCRFEFANYTWMCSQNGYRFKPH